ncbi:hypothetical protein RZS08_09045 [Arthrospira platensis SPKY1]|nr:hypothetical protein [Arthrospira platensis SPKY1]
MAGRKKIIKGVSSARKKAIENKEFMDMAAEQQIDHIFDEIVEKGSKKFYNELMGLSGKEYVDRYMQVVEYIKPKLSKVDKVGGEDGRVTLNFITSGSSKGVEILNSKKDDNVLLLEEFEE